MPHASLLAMFQSSASSTLTGVVIAGFLTLTIALVGASWKLLDRLGDIRGDIRVQGAEFSGLRESVQRLEETSTDHGRRIGDLEKVVPVVEIATAMDVFVRAAKEQAKARGAAGD